MRGPRRSFPCRTRMHRETRRTDAPCDAEAVFIVRGRQAGYVRSSFAQGNGPMNGNASLPRLLAAAAVLAAASCAHDPRPEEPSSYVGKRIQMQELDRNRDGFLTRDE